MSNKWFISLMIIVGIIGYVLGFSLGAYAGQHEVNMWVLAVLALTLMLPGIAIVYYRCKAVNASLWWVAASLLPIVSVFSFARLAGGQKEGDWWYNH